MALIFLRSGGSDANPGTDKGAPKGSLQSAMAAAGADGAVYVSALHSETLGISATLSGPTSALTPVRVLCVPDWGVATGTTPPTAHATGATVTTTGNTTVSFGGFAFFHGITFSGGSGAAGGGVVFLGTTPFYGWFHNCTLKVGTTDATARFTIGPNSPLVDSAGITLVNSNVQFAVAAQAIVARAPVVWRGGSVLGVAPTVLFDVPSGESPYGFVDVAGVDTSLAGQLVNAANNTFARYTFTDCKVSASAATAGGGVLPGGVRVTLVNCSNTDTVTNYRRDVWGGLETDELVIVRTGGANDGTTPFARKIVTTAATSVYAPYESGWITIWNETLAPVTITIPVTTSAVTLTDVQAWIEVEYLGTAGTPLGVFVSDRHANPYFGTPVAQPLDTANSWGGALATPVKQLLSVTVTPVKKGLLRARVCVARPSTTVYYDPEPVVT